MKKGQIKINPIKDYELSTIDTSIKEDKEYPVRNELPTPYWRGNDLFLQFWGWGIHLSNDGTWFMEDTSGG